MNFYRNNCADCSDFEELKEAIGSVEVKDNLGFEISRFTLQIYVFVYQTLIYLPSARFDFEALTTQNLMESVHTVSSKEFYLRCAERKT